MVKEWGEERARKVLSIRIHVTEKSKDEAAAYRAEIRNTSLYKSKQIVRKKSIYSLFSNLKNV